MAASKDKKDTQRKEEWKVFNDPIHGSMKLHPLLVKIIDTPQFQRLRNIKQLGATYWVFPGASHNRFEHSIGVCYLAGQLVEALKDKQPELDITKEDVLCVQVAGLCHDLGHGPFSHMFDNMFIPRAQEKKEYPREKPGGKKRRKEAEESAEERCPRKKWKHEDASVMMFDHLVQENNLEAIMEEMKEKWKLSKELDLDFIKELINGPQKAKKGPNKDQKEDKSFLYQIVANKRNGIDVDKWDYFARDCHHLGIQNNFDHRRFIEFARVCKDENGEKQICIRDKEVINVCDMFQIRRSLHLKAYQHRVCNIIEIMITEAFLEADKHLKLSDAIYDPKAYTKLTDHVFNQILTSHDPELKKPREILEKITKRDFYKFVGQTRPNTPLPNTQRDDLLPECRNLEVEIAQTVPEGGGPNVILRAVDFVVDIISIDHRIAKNSNPLDNVRVYTKSKPDTGIPISEAKKSMLLPNSLAVQLIRVYCKKTDDTSMKAARRKFEQWCIKKGYTEWMEISTPPGPNPQQPQ